jgi:hypothetical protein
MMRSSLVLVVSLLACSSSESNDQPASDTGTAGVDTAVADTATGTDTAVADTNKAETSELPACGDPPYTIEAGNVMLLGTDGTMTPKGGVTITPTLCPTVSQTTAADGKYGFRISSGKPVSLRYEGADITKQLRGEYAFTTDSTAGLPTVFPKTFTTILPDWGAGKAAIFATGRVTGGTGACATLDGVSVSVDGHPEAKITYYGESMPPMAMSGATATTKSGMVAITGIAAPASVKVVATKMGCMATFARAPRTGMGPLEADVVTMMSFSVSN